MSFYDWLRILNIGISAAVVLAMVLQLPAYKRQTTQVRLLGMGLLLLVLSNAYSALESLLRDVPGGPRVVLATIPLVLLLLACLWPVLEGRRKR